MRAAAALLLLLAGCTGSPRNDSQPENENAAGLCGRAGIPLDECSERENRKSQ